MAITEFKITGLDAINRKLSSLANRIPNEVARALFEEAQIEATEVRRRVPVDTGALRQSVTVEKPVIAGRDISVSIVCGGPSAPYALYVHENMHALHKVGQAKFLESVILESKPYMALRVARRIELDRLF